MYPEETVATDARVGLTSNLDAIYGYLGVERTKAQFSPTEQFSRIENLSQFNGATALEEAGVVVDEVVRNSSNIGPEFFTQNERLLYQLDPSVLSIVRAAIGPKPFTQDALNAIRDNWCYSDLPQDLYQAIQVQGDEEFVQTMKRLDLNPYGQTKTYHLVKSGRLEQLVKDRSVNQGAPVAEKPVRTPFSLFRRQPNQP